MISKYNKAMKADRSIYLIGRIHEKANEFILKELEKVGLKDIAPSHGDILATLFQHDECTMTYLADNIHRDRSTVTALVNKLIKLGYISSRKGPKDNRSTMVFLTEKGRELETGFKEISLKLYAVEYKGISEAEKEIFKSILNKIHGNF
ncbi:transcriptional regulator [Clostridium pasteurianum BC1]|uniref:Transcriptional regulator n=2 Tax=Clostridium pasteurianum TaxID=1501 RepID=R4K8B0_CLOPA|nr:transcriptional regulator [Clostridium pasteurianum BC1]